MIDAWDGDDTIMAGGGADTIDAGFGADAVDGGAGNDTYVYNRWDGADTIVDAAGIDTLVFGGNITTDDIVAAIDYTTGDLVLGIIDRVEMLKYMEMGGEGAQYIPNPTTMDQRVTITNWRSLDQRLERFVFAEGAEMSAMELYNRYFASWDDDNLQGLEGDNDIEALGGNDTVLLGSGNDTVDAGAGNDWVSTGGGDDLIISGEGSDMLFAGAGNDRLEGGTGDDNYHINPGDGQDHVFDQGGFDALVVGGDLALDDVVIEKQGHDGLVTLRDGSSAFIQDWELPNNRVENIRFSDGTDVSIESRLGTFQARHYNLALDEDTALGGSIEALNAEGALTFTLEQGSAHGGFVLNPDGSWNYQPTENYFGEDSAVVRVTDAAGNTALSHIRLGVAPVNDAPVAPETEDHTLQDIRELTGTLSATDVDGDTLTYSVSGAPANGSFSIDPDGNWTYAAADLFAGADSAEITVSDGNGGVATTTLNFDVKDSSPDISEPGIIQLNEDTATEDLLVVSNPMGGDLTWEIIQDSVNGDFSLDADGSLTYIPSPDYNGADSVTVKVTNVSGLSDTTTLTFEVALVNDVPVAAAVEEHTLQNIRELAGTLAATDVDGDALTYTVSGAPANGSLAIDADGNWTYTPADLFMGADSAEITVSDGNGGTVTTALNFDVQVSAPVIDDRTVGLDEDAGTGDLLAVSNPVGGALTWEVTQGSTNGDFAVDGDGNYTYTPAPDYNGTDSVTLTVTNAYGLSDTTTLTFEVAPVNDAPVAPAAEEHTLQDIRELAGTLVATDVDGDELAYTVSSQPANGSLAIDADGNWTYTPADLFMGNDSAVIIVSDGQGGEVASTLNFDVMVSAPVIDDRTINLDEDASTGDVLSVVNPIGGTLTWEVTQGSVNGDFSLDADGNYIYTPTADYNGSDSVTLTVTNAYGLSDTTTLTFDVAPVNDAPVAPVEENHTLQDIRELAGTLAAADVDGDTLTYTVSGAPANGYLSIDTGGNWTYTPADLFMGADSVQVTITDGNGGEVTTTLNFDVKVSAPVIEDRTINLDEDNSADDLLSVVNPIGGALDWEVTQGSSNGEFTVDGDGNYVYTPAPDYNGSDSVILTVTNAYGLSDTTTLTFDVAPVNDAPVAPVEENHSLQDIRELAGTLAATDVDGDTLTYTVSGAPANGSLSMTADGNWTYIPADLYMGADSAQVTITDGNGGEVTTTLNFDVKVSAPVIDDQTVALDEDTSAGDVLAVINPIGGALTWEVTRGSSNGDFNLGADGNYTYAPAPDYNGSDQVTLTVTNAYGLSDSMTLTFAVAPVNDVPVAPPQQDFTMFGTSQLTGAIGAEDIDGDTLAYTVTGEPVHGAFSVDADGQWVYVPDDDFAGKDTVTIQVDDGNGGTTSTELLLSVNEYNGGDAVIQPGGTGTFNLDGVSKDDLQLTRQSSDLRIAIRDRGTLTVSGYFNSGYQGVERMNTIEGRLELGHTSAYTMPSGGGSYWWQPGWLKRFFAGGQWGEENLIYGNASGNIIGGREQSDVLFGAGGNDYLFGFQGNDTLVGGDQHDIICGLSGDDTLYGDAGRDYLVDLGGNDALIGGVCSDHLEGGDGNDWLFGDSGNDHLEGGRGDDILTGGTGCDTLKGGSGDDIYRFSAGHGYDVIYEKTKAWGCGWKNEGGADTIQSGADVDRSDVALFSKRGRLYLQYGDQDIVKVEKNGNRRPTMERVELADGSYMEAVDINRVIQEMSSYAANEGICLRSVEDVRKNDELMTIAMNGWQTV